MGPLYDSHGNPLPQPGGPNDFHGVAADSLLSALLLGKGVEGLAAFTPEEVQSLLSAIQSGSGVEGFAPFAPEQSLLDALNGGTGVDGFQPFQPYDISAAGTGSVTVPDYGTFTQGPTEFSPEAIQLMGGQQPDYVSGEPSYTDYGGPIDYTGGTTDYGGGYTDPGYTDASYAGDVSAGDFATGGRFTVPGSIGTKVPLRMNAHAGEEVSVAPINRRPWDGDEGRGGDRGADEMTEVRKIGGAFGKTGAESIHFHIYGDGGGSSGALPRGMSRAALARDFRRALAMA
jgi:hypothetical protein